MIEKISGLFKKPYVKLRVITRQTIDSLATITWFDKAKTQGDNIVCVSRYGYMLTIKLSSIERIDIDTEKKPGTLFFGKLYCVNGIEVEIEAY